MDWLIDLDELESDVSHRPGKLYRFNTVHIKDFKAAEIYNSET